MIINFPGNKQIVTYILSALLLALFPARLCASALTLAWDPNTEPDLAGYRVYYGTASGVYVDSVNAGNTTTYRLDGLLDGVTYYIAVTAYDTSGNESDFSKEVSGIGTSPSCCTKPTLRAPTGDQPTYRWDCGGGQWEWFWVYVQNLSTGVLYGSGWVNASTNTWTQPSPLPWGNYRVWVRVYHSECGFSEWSDPVDWSVGNCCLKPTVQTPSGDQPTYQWSCGSGEWTWYWVYVLNANTGAYYGTGSASYGWVNSLDNFWSSTRTLPAGDYQGWVRVYHENCGLSEWSDPVDWSVGGAPAIQNSFSMLR